MGFGPSAIFLLPQPLVLAALEVGGWAVTSALLERGRLSERALRTVMSLLGLGFGLALAFAYNPIPSQLSALYVVPFLTTLFLVLGVWMLGGFHASETVSYDRLYNEFRLGLTMIAVSALMATLFARASVNTIWSEMGGVALLFFGAGLAGLALSNREVVRHETGDAGLRSWGVILVASVGAILLLGVVAQGIGQGDIVGAFQSVVTGRISGDWRPGLWHYHAHFVAAQLARYTFRCSHGSVRSADCGAADYAPGPFSGPAKPV